jgi:hypothetical protein
MKMDNSEPEKIGALMAAYQDALQAARDSERIYKRDCAVAEKARRALVRFRAEQMGQFDDLLEVQRLDALHAGVQREKPAIEDKDLAQWAKLGEEPKDLPVAGVPKTPTRTRWSSADGSWHPITE